MLPGAGHVDATTRLRAAGLRATDQRRAVLEALGALGHASVDQLAAAVQATMPEVSLSTVYRTLEALDAVGLVTHTHLHHGAPTYHSVDDEPHLHLVCEGCGAVDQQSVEVALGLADAVRRSRGFRVDLTHLALHGRCAACVEQAADAGADAAVDAGAEAAAGPDDTPGPAAVIGLGAVSLGEPGSTGADEALSQA